MPSTIGKCKLFRIKHITLLEGEKFLRNKRDIAFFEIKCTFLGIFIYVEHWENYEPATKKILCKADHFCLFIGLPHEI